MKHLTRNNFTFFVTIVTFLAFSSCKTASYKKQSFKTERIGIDANSLTINNVDNFIEPYREKITAEMSKELAYNPSDLLKDDKNLNAPIGNLMADASFEMANPIFLKKTGKNIDFVLLNWGGIRSHLSKGKVTVGDIYAIMPFENKAVVLTLKGEKVAELVAYLAQHKKPHPISQQVDLQIDRKGNIKQFLINGTPFDVNKEYRVLTSDYLMNGGDAMYFFSNPAQYFDLEYSLRNILIDYFDKIDEVKAVQDNRFIYVE